MIIDPGGQYRDLLAPILGIMPSLATFVASKRRLTKTLMNLFKFDKSAAPLIPIYHISGLNRFNVGGDCTGACLISLVWSSNSISLLLADSYNSTIVP